MMENVEECQLCYRVVDTTTRKPVTSLSNCLYHKTVQETLLPSPDVLEGDAPGVEGRVPKLTFTFSFGGPQSYSNDEMLLCDACLKEVEQLESLHQQLESCKKLITAQVERIENACGTEDTAIRGNRKKESLWIKGPMGFPSEVALAGTSIGNDNISQLLHCLGSLCNGISQGYGCSVQSLQAGDASQVLHGVTKMERDNIDEGNVFNTDAMEPFVDESVKSNIDLTRNNQQETLQSSFEISHNSLTTDNDIREVFLHPVKFNPISPDPRNDVTSSLGQLEASRNYYSDPVDTTVDPLEEDYEYKPTVSVSANLTTHENSSTPTPVHHNPRQDNSDVSKHKTLISLLTLPPTKRTRTKRAKINKSNQWSCEICGKRIKRGSMSGHMKIHTGETPFKCELCGKGFLASVNLEDHRRTHTGEKPFACNLCDYSFTQRSNLNRHIRRIHKVNVKIWE